MNRLPKSWFSSSFFIRLFLTAGIMLLATNANAGPITVFSAQDNGAPTTGPFPNSSAEQTAFQTAAGAFGAINTITFESLPVGYSSSFNAAPGVNVSLTGTNFGPGFSGISNTTLGNLFGFNVTPGGSKWLGFPGGTATFTFTNSTNSFGFWLTGLQTTFSSSVTITFNDGTQETLHAPVTRDGGAEYYGFTDGTSVAAVTISDPGIDAWGIDDVTYNTLAATPEPSSLMLLGSGVLGLAGIVRRRMLRGA